MGSSIKRIRYRYDARGNRKALIDQDGGRFTYSYDAVRRITQVINPQGDRTSYSYDAAGRRTVKKLANGARASFSYDNVGHLTRLANLKSDGTTISSFNYKYDEVGNRTSVLEADGSRVTWSYDDTYQLTGEHRTGSHAYRNTFAYDPAGNRTLKNEDGARTTYSYDAANQLTKSVDASGTTTYTFDEDGNQKVVEAPNGDRTTMSWDCQNRMTSVQQPDGIRSTMAYEPGGLRVKLEESTGTRKFVWDGNNNLAQTDANNDTDVVYTNDPLPFGSLASQKTATGISTFHFDAPGSTRQVTDASETVSDTRLYEYWGQILDATGATSFSPQFLGRNGARRFADTTLDYSRRQAYSPKLARSLSRLRSSARAHYSARTPLATFAAMDAHAGEHAPDHGAGLDAFVASCIRDCEESCIEQYPNWHQYVQRLGCVVGCGAECRGAGDRLLDVFCDYLANFTHCQEALLHCTCLMIEAGVTSINLPLAYINDPYFISKLVCILASVGELGCDSLVAAQGLCKARKGHELLIAGLLGGLDAIDAFKDIVGCLSGFKWEAPLVEFGVDWAWIGISLALENQIFGHHALDACCELWHLECANELMDVDIFAIAVIRALARSLAVDPITGARQEMALEANIDCLCANADRFL